MHCADIAVRVPYQRNHGRQITALGMRGLGPEADARVAREPRQTSLGEVLGSRRGAGAIAVMPETPHAFAGLRGLVRGLNPAGADALVGNGHARPPAISATKL